jgi:hypothetical protein
MLETAESLLSRLRGYPGRDAGWTHCRGAISMRLIGRRSTIRATSPGPLTVQQLKRSAR